MASKSWRDTYGGGFLKASDLSATGKEVQILDVVEKIIRNGESPKLVAELRGEKPWVVNATNCESLEEISGSEDPGDWKRLKVRLVNDKSVRGPNGEVGGIRVRPPAKKPSRRKPKKSDIDDDLADLEDDDEDEEFEDDLD